MAPSDVELVQLPERRLNEENFGPADASPNIPPPDRGRAAYLFLLSCFGIESLVWGFAFSFGIFQEHYTKAFPGQTNIAVIGTCCMGIMYLISPIVFLTLKKWPILRRPAPVAGLFIMCIAMAAASFSTTVTDLILTHGILYAIGGSICYSPTILFVDEWFIQRKGLAFGIMWAGTGVSGVVFPLLLQWLLNSYGFRTTLRIWSVALFLLTFPLLYFLRPRLPLDRTVSRRGKIFDLRFLYNPVFLIMQACNICEALGFFLPTIYLPTFASDILHTSPLVAAGTVIAVNVASVFGCVAMGSLIDRFHVTICIMVSTVGATIGVFVLWGLSTSLPLLYIFCVVYGLFAGSFTSTWTGIMKLTQRRVEGADAGLIFSFLAFGRGVGNVLSGPLSEGLLKGQPWLHDAALAYGTGYGPLIAFTGVSALLGGCSFVARGFGRRAWF